MSDEKPVLAINFKGCVALNYDKDGWVPPTFFDWAVDAYKHFKLVIYSAEIDTEDMENYVRNFQIPWRHTKIASGHANAKDELQLEFSKEKPNAFLTIDDRTVTFPGRWDLPFLGATELLNFTPQTDVKVLYKLPDGLGIADAAQRASNVAPPPDAARKCPKHPWMTKQHENGSRSCMVTTCAWTSPPPS
jgi:hypothetical protein